MAYSTNLYLPKARGLALQLLIREQLPVQIVAHRSGVHRSTIWRWKQKWLKLNGNVQLENTNRPGRTASEQPVSTFRLSACRWNIPTVSSRPHHHPRTISSEIVRQVLAARQQLQRCAEVVWHYVTHTLHLVVSLSSVRRILRRHHCFDGARKKRVRSDNPRRPKAAQTGGELIETDTIHHVDPMSGKRLYYYTVIDLYSRMAYVTVAPVLRQGLAVQAILAAREAFGFPFAMVQTDNGPEYRRYFEQVLRQKGIVVRHTRLGRPNDNAHIERFNRTLQEECIGYFWRRSVPLWRQRDTLDAYLDYYNTKRVHLGIQLRTPVGMLQRF